MTGKMKVGHEAGVVPGIERGPAVNQDIDLTPPVDPCKSIAGDYPKVQFVDNPEDWRGRGRLDLSTGEYLR